MRGMKAGSLNEIVGRALRGINMSDNICYVN